MRRMSKRPGEEARRSPLKALLALPVRRSLRPSSVVSSVSERQLGPFLSKRSCIPGRSAPVSGCSRSQHAVFHAARPSPSRRGYRTDPLPVETQVGAPLGGIWQHTTLVADDADRRRRCSQRTLIADDADRRRPVAQKSDFKIDVRFKVVR